MPLYDTSVDEVIPHFTSLGLTTLLPLRDSLAFFTSRRTSHIMVRRHVLHFNQAWRSFTSASQTTHPSCARMAAWRFGVYTGRNGVAQHCITYALFSLLFVCFLCFACHWRFSDTEFCFDLQTGNDGRIGLDRNIPHDFKHVADLFSLVGLEECSLGDREVWL